MPGSEQVWALPCIIIEKQKTVSASIFLIISSVNYYKDYLKGIIAASILAVLTGLMIKE
jgi:hypothetical protein